MNQIAFLFAYELEELIEALRRDYRSEKRLANEYPIERDHHEKNARVAIRLLETLNPRQPRREKKDQRSDVVGIAIYGT